MRTFNLSTFLKFRSDDKLQAHAAECIQDESETAQLQKNDMSVTKA